MMEIKVSRAAYGKDKTPESPREVTNFKQHIA
jgi:hypothetical protein